jgi:hypothetical protein
MSELVSVWKFPARSEFAGNFAINDISSLGRRFGSSEPKQPPGGKMRLPSHETRFDFANLPHSPRYRDNAVTPQAFVLPVRLSRSMMSSSIRSAANSALR